MSMMTEALLRQMPLFAALPREEIAFLASAMPVVDVPAQTILLHEGEGGDRFYVVLDGTLEIVKALATADERVLRVCGPGEFVGELSLLSPDRRRTASARTSTPAQLLEIAESAFDALLHRQPDVAYQMVRVIGARLREADDATIRDLQGKNRELSVAYRDLAAAQAQIIEQETLERELQVAREIQESMLPRILPQMDGFDFGAMMLPARAVGGDFFDLFPLGPDKVGVVIGDVSGKGVPAALFMALTRSLVRAEASRAVGPSEALQRTNHHLLEMNAAGMFVTVLYGVLDRTTGVFGYSRAGHELPLLVDAGGTVAPPQLEIGIGQPLGVFERPRLDEQTVIIPKGGLLLLTTDGVTDALDPAGTCFGIEGLVAALRGLPRGPGPVVCTGIVQAVQRHQATARQYDDLTLLALCHLRPM